MPWISGNKLLACFGALVLLALPVCIRAQSRQSSDEKLARLDEAGVTAFSNQDTTTARKLFADALLVMPNDPIAHTYLGYLADRENQFGLAEKHFRAAASADPNSASAHNNYGAILVRLGRTEAAAAEFETSLRLDPNQRSALSNLAQLRFKNREFVNARDLWQRAMSIAPDAETARALVVLALQMKDSSQAAAAYAQYRQQIDGDVGNASNVTARAEFGDMLLRGGLATEAASELTAAATAEPNNHRILQSLARAYLASGNIPMAGRTLEAAVARGIYSGSIYATLADIYELSGHIENAIPAMRLAIEQEPKNESYRFRYAMLLTDTKVPAAAVIRLHESLAEFPNSAKLWFALGVAYFADHKEPDAIGAFKKSLDIDRKFAPALAYLGMIQAEQGQYSEATKLYGEALAIDDNLAIVHYLVAITLLKEATPDVELAESHLLRSLSLDSSFADAELSLGKLYQRASRWEESNTHLERAIKLNGRLAEAHYQLGRNYSRQKRTNDAQVELTTFRQLSEAQKEQSENDRREVVRRLANVRF